MAGKISPAEWAEIVTSYQRGEKSILDLAEEYGVTHQAISKGLRARGISRTSTLTEHAQDDDADRARKDREAQVAAAKKRQETYAKYNDAIVQMTMKRLIDADKASTPLSLSAKDIRVLKDAGAIVQRARIENWEILKVEDLLGDGEDLPDLNVGEYTPEEIEEIRRANEEHYVEANDLGGELDFDLDDDEDDVGG